MDESTFSLEKLLNSTIKHKFPNVIDRIEVKEEDLDNLTYYLHVFVFLKNHDKIRFQSQIEEYIKQISKYVLKPQGKLINQITFGMEV